MCLSGSWSMQTGRAMEGPAMAEEAEGAAEGLAEETIDAAVIMAMGLTIVAIPAAVAATLVVAAIPAAVAATLPAVLVVVAQTIVVVELPTDQVLLLPGTTRRTPWAPLTSAPLAGTSQCPRVSLMHMPYRYFIYIALRL